MLEFWLFISILWMCVCDPTYSVICTILPPWDITLQAFERCCIYFIDGEADMMIMSRRRRRRRCDSFASLIRTVYVIYILTHETAYIDSYIKSKTVTHTHTEKKKEMNQIISMKKRKFMNGNNNLDLCFHF